MTIANDPEQKQKLLLIPFAHGSITSDTAIKLWQPDRKFRIDRVWYNNITGLAEDPTNFFTVQILNDTAGDVAFSHSTETTAGDGSLAADTPVDLQASATDADMIVAADDVLTLNLDEDGTATLPAGTGVIEGRYVD